MHEVEFDNLFPEREIKEGSKMDLLLDVPVEVRVELGRTNMEIKEVLNIGQGSIVELNKLAGEPVDIVVHDKVIAQGNVVMVDDKFAVKIAQVNGKL